MASAVDYIFVPYDQLLDTKILDPYKQVENFYRILVCCTTIPIRAEGMVHMIEDIHYPQTNCRTLLMQVNKSQLRQLRKSDWSGVYMIMYKIAQQPQPSTEVLRNILEEELLLQGNDASSTIKK